MSSSPCKKGKTSEDDDDAKERLSAAIRIIVDKSIIQDEREEIIVCALGQLSYTILKEELLTSEKRKFNDVVESAITESYHDVFGADINGYDDSDDDSDTQLARDNAYDRDDVLLPYDYTFLTRVIHYMLRRTKDKDGFEPELDVAREISEEFIDSNEYKSILAFEEWITIIKEYATRRGITFNKRKVF